MDPNSGLPTLDDEQSLVAVAAHAHHSVHPHSAHAHTHTHPHTPTPHHQTHQHDLQHHRPTSPSHRRTPLSKRVYRFYNDTPVGRHCVLCGQRYAKTSSSDTLKNHLDKKHVEWRDESGLPPLTNATPIRIGQNHNSPQNIMGTTFHRSSHPISYLPAMSLSAAHPASGQAAVPTGPLTPEQRNHLLDLITRWCIASMANVAVVETPQFLDILKFLNPFVDPITRDVIRQRVNNILGVDET
ncbi:hypothetical protein BC832DRAFT_589926 [Gaertneriomyces semiglobifer]|nr:hypothetical protein BC832DRAFT_589926 [Gaertneriomyces semiglobifer]